MKKNINGSVMIWAIVVILIFSVFAALALSISYSMVKRSTNEIILRQLSLTSKSAALIVSTAICDSSNPELCQKIVDRAPSSVSANDFFDGKEDMRECNVKAKFKDDTIIVSATSVEGELSYTYSAVIKKLGESSWSVVSYDNFDVDYERNDGV